MTHLPTKIFNVNIVFIKSILCVIVYKVPENNDRAVVDTGGIPHYHLTNITLLSITYMASI